jgi:hypothetical protein
MTLVRGALHASHSRCVASQAGQPLYMNLFQCALHASHSRRVVWQAGQPLYMFEMFDVRSTLATLDLLCVNPGSPCI